MPSNVKILDATNLVAALRERKEIDGLMFCVDTDAEGRLDRVFFVMHGAWTSGPVVESTTWSCTTRRMEQIPMG